ncbi:dihydrolipoamide acetyltransferase family protein, partial [Dermatophilus congolensis]
PASATTSSVDIRTLAVPGVRRYARSKGVDLTCITGSGNHGKITREDIDAYLANGASIQPATPAPTTKEKSTPAAESTPHPATVSSGQRREKMSAIRKAAARALIEVATTVPVVTILDRVEVSALVAHRNRLKDTAATRKAKLTYTPYIVKACVAMLKKNPLMNGRVDMAAGEFIYYDTFNIGVATNTDRGLFVPIIKDADRKSLFDIAREITELSNRAKAGTLTNADMSGGSMTVTNVGGFATSGVWSTPIINAPEAVILGIGRFEDEFLPDKKGKPVLRPVCKLSFAFDHRLIDGVDAQKALNDLKEFLHNPDLLLAES